MFLKEIRQFRSPQILGLFGGSYSGVVKLHQVLCYQQIVEYRGYVPSAAGIRRANS